MTVRIAKKVLWPRGIKHPARSDAVVDAAVRRMRRYVGQLPPAWDGIALAASRMKSYSALMRNDIEHFMEVYRTPPWLRPTSSRIRDHERETYG